MTRIATMIGGLAIALTASLVPPPQRILQNPKALYGAAVLKVLAGDANSALRLLERSSQPVPQKPATNTASTCSQPKRG